MCQDVQTDLAGLAVIVPRPQGRAKVPLEHAEDGFDLPTLAVGFLGEAAGELLAVFAVDCCRLAATIHRGLHQMLCLNNKRPRDTH